MERERHPRELPALFLTEMWERFSFYLMLGLLTLYMTDTSLGGLGFSKEKTGGIFGTYVAAVYLTPFIGGMLADRILGYRRAIVLGGVLMCLGHISLAFEGTGFFYAGLGLLIAGNGFFKPNISTLLGRLYPEGSRLRDAGFNIFYVGINLGAFICNFVAAILRNKYGWHAAFGSAGIGMLIGVLVFLTVYRRLERAEITPAERNTGEQDDGSIRTLVRGVLPASIALGVGGYWLMGMTGAFLAACLPVGVYFFNLWRNSNETERGPLGALLAISVLLIPFWMVFQLYGTAMTFWAEENTKREVPSWSYSALQSVDLLQDAPPTYFQNASPETPRPSQEWLRVVEGGEKEVAEAKKQHAEATAGKPYAETGPWPVTQKEYDAIYAGAGQEQLQRGVPWKVANAELFQSVNPFLVMLLTPLLLGVFQVLRRMGLEPSTPKKIGLGMVFGGLYMLVMVVAVAASDDGALKQSPWWIFGAYAVITTGELCLSPVGLSLVTKLAPRRLGAVMMGGFFLSIAVGNKLSGFIGGLWEKVNHTTFFLLLAVIMAVFATIIFGISSWLERHMPKEG